MRSPGLFNGFWFDMEGRRLGRIRQDEYPTLYGLWREHRDLREGRPRVACHFCRRQRALRDAESIPTEPRDPESPEERAALWRCRERDSCERIYRRRAA